MAEWMLMAPWANGHIGSCEPSERRLATAQRRKRMKSRLTHPRGILSLRQAGMTLTETLVSVALTVLTITGTINGYILSTNRAEWSAQSLAAHSMALQRLEQVRAAKWDTAAYPSVDQVISDRFPAQT